MAEACGTAYYRYGAALLYRAQEEQDVFGDDMKSAAQQRDVQVRCMQMYPRAAIEAHCAAHAPEALKCENIKLARDEGLSHGDARGWLLIASSCHQSQQ